MSTGILVIIFIIAVIYGILIHLVRDVGNEYSVPPRYNNYNPPNSQEKGTVIYANYPRQRYSPFKRIVPPRATFFSREDGEQYTTNGKYEEKYLNNWDLKMWKTQKIRREAIEAGLVDETPEDDY